jgi:hypothetical protein
MDSSTQINILFNGKNYFACVYNRNFMYLSIADAKQTEFRCVFSAANYNQCDMQFVELVDQLTNWESDASVRLSR